ncbi:hypothetical protein TeGR_g13783, partial [Tetraparma gracilis]
RARVVLNLANLLQQSVNSVTGGTKFMYDKSFADVLYWNSPLPDAIAELLKSACFWDCPCWTWRGAEFFGTLCFGDDEVAADIAANRHGLVATIVDLLDHKMPNDDEEEESSWTLKVRAS